MSLRESVRLLHVIVPSCLDCMYCSRLLAARLFVYETILPVRNAVKIGGVLDDGRPAGVTDRSV